MENFSKFVNELEQKRRELQQESDKVYIVNAGSANHGKSSLLNSLLGTDKFEVGDWTGVTEKDQAAEYRKDVYLVDTPGLRADNVHTEEAFKLYKKANFILLVHNPDVGEFHRGEIEYVRIIADTVGKDYFWEHAALVLTFSEKVDEQNLDLVEQQIQKELNKEFQKTLPVFRVSNILFAKGRNETNEKKKAKFLEFCGIPKLEDFLSRNISKWQSENMCLQTRRFETERSNVLNALFCRKEELQRKHSKRNDDYKRQSDDLSGRLTKAIGEAENIDSQLQSQENRLNQEERELSDLISQHQSDRARY